MHTILKKIFLLALALTFASPAALAESAKTLIGEDAHTSIQRYGPTILYSDGLQASRIGNLSVLAAELEFANNDKMMSLLNEAIHEAGSSGFVYLLKLNDFGLYKLIYGDGRLSMSFTELKLSGSKVKIFSAGQMSMEDLYQTPLVQRIFAQLKSADPIAIKAQLEVLQYARSEEQRAKIAKQAAQNIDMMEKERAETYLVLYQKQEIELFKKLLTKLQDFEPLNEHDKQMLKNKLSDLNQRIKEAASNQAVLMRAE